MRPDYVRFTQESAPARRKLTADDLASLNSWWVERVRPIELVVIDRFISHG